MQEKNMTRLITTILIYGLLFQSCNFENIDNNIIQFETTLSKKNTKVLNGLVKELDSFLLKRYPSNNSLHNSYRAFLARICQYGNYNDLSTDSIFFENLQKQFRNSSLLREIILIPEDLTLINENKSLFRQYKYTDTKSEIDQTLSDTFLLPPNPNNKDLTTIDFYRLLDRNEKLRLFNVYGEYYRGLEKVKPRSEFISNYLDFKNQVLHSKGNSRFYGFSDFSIEACNLLNSNVNLTDYFVKRIILIELIN
jgi:hypothetical protein